MTDPGNEFVLELAVAAKCLSIVTHNVRDFREAHTFNIQVLTPAEFLRAVREEP